MQLSDLTVEVRDKMLNRVGVIRPEDLDLEIADQSNNVGEWTLTLAVEHPLAPAITTPGAGIIVTGPGDVLVSGPVVAVISTLKTNDPRGTLTISGVSDNVVLADALCFPQPSNADPTTQTLSHDVRSGAAETVMHQYVAANIGPAAPQVRRKGRPDGGADGYCVGVQAGTNGGRGPTVSKAARFAQLGVFLQEIADVAGLSFRVVQRGNQLQFETWPKADRSLTVRLSVLNGNLSSQKIALTAPGVTDVIVAGQGEQEDRVFRAATNADANAARIEWNRRIESYIDQRQTDDPAVYDQKIAEVLALSGFTGVNVQSVPVDDINLRFAVDYNLGDKVSIIIENIERVSFVTGYVLRVDKSGVRLGVVIGDQAIFDPSASTIGRLTDVEKRLAYLEQR